MSAMASATIAFNAIVPNQNQLLAALGDVGTKSDVRDLETACL